MSHRGLRGQRRGKGCLEFSEWALRRGVGVTRTHVSVIVIGSQARNPVCHCLAAAALSSATLLASLLESKARMAGFQPGGADRRRPPLNSGGFFHLVATVLTCSDDQGAPACGWFLLSTSSPSSDLLALPERRHARVGPGGRAVQHQHGGREAETDGAAPCSLSTGRPPRLPAA